MTRYIHTHWIPRGTDRVECHPTAPILTVAFNDEKDEYDLTISFQPEHLNALEDLVAKLRNKINDARNEAARSVQEPRPHDPAGGTAAVLASR